MLLLAAACSDADRNPSQPPPDIEQASHPAEEPAAKPFEESPLTRLTPDAVRYLLGREGHVGVAVVVPARRMVYSWNGNDPFSMASTVKVPIMLTLLSQASEQGRWPSDKEQAALHAMITASDNESAYMLWDQVGGGTAVQSFMRSLGLEGMVLDGVEMPGDSLTTPRDLALLFAKLAGGGVLDTAMRDFAVGLLGSVQPGQDWGVMASALPSVEQGAIVGLKDGWYPAEDGWWVNSAGFLHPAGGGEVYAIAVLSNGQPTWEYGIETIETVATLVYGELQN